MVLLPLYLATTVTAQDTNVDAEAAALPAWQLAREGTVDLRGVDTLGNPWINMTDKGRLISNRPLGLSLLAVPAYLLWGDETFSSLPSTHTAAVVSVLAVLVVHLVLRRCVPPGWALGGAVVLGLGTATWPISSAQLWPHGPGQLLLALALLAMASRRPVLAGAAFGAEVLVRPVAAVAPVATAAVAALRRRWRDGAVLMVAAGIGLCVVVAFNKWAFGRPSLSGGYGSGVRDNLTGQSPWGYLTNLVALVASPRNGLLVWSPVLAVALVAMPRAWSLMPSWARSGAIGGLAYVLVHARLNRASGGLAFDYRYPLEALALAAPALAVSAREFALGSDRRHRVLVLAVIASILLQGMVAVTLECTSSGLSEVTCSLG